MKDETVISVNSETISSTVDKVENALGIMAEKLGMASDHFYPILVKQQLIEGWVHMGITIPLFIIGGLLFLIGLGKEHRGDEEGNWAVFIGLIFYVIASLIFAGYLTQILNPEYYALMEIKSFIK